jgi:hypothetical protein
LFLVLTGCVKTTKPYVEPTGLLFWMIVVAFGIAVLSAIYGIFGKDDGNQRRGFAGFVGFIFLMGSIMLLLFSNGCNG